MIVKSYLIYPLPQQKSSLQDKLQQFPQCDVIPATNQDLLVLVTATDNQTDDETLYTQIKHLPQIQVITLISGHNDHIIPLQTTH
ncbi:MAG TPA: hypothetical protein VLL52_22270 [Anaerolineae bacterium]|nr:hypothetical protein [Anaerolineae bacterium]